MSAASLLLAEKLCHHQPNLLLLCFSSTCVYKEGFYIGLLGVT